MLVMGVLKADAMVLQPFEAAGECWPIMVIGVICEMVHGDEDQQAGFWLRLTSCQNKQSKNEGEHGFEFHFFTFLIYTRGWDFNLPKVRAFRKVIACLQGPHGLQMGFQFLQGFSVMVPFLVLFGDDCFRCPIHKIPVGQLSLN